MIPEFFTLLFVLIVAALTYHEARHDLFHPVVLVNGIVTYFVLIPAVYILAGGKFRYSIGDVNSALMWGILAFGAVYLTLISVYYLVDFESLVERVPNVGQFSVQPQHLFGLGLGSLLVGIASYSYYLHLNGSLMRLLTVTPRTAFQTVPNSARWKLLAISGLFGGMVLIATSFRPYLGDGKGRATWWHYVILVMVCGLTTALMVTFRERMLIVFPAGYVLFYLADADVISDRQFIAVGAIVGILGIGFTFIEHVFISHGATRVAFLVDGAVNAKRLKAWMAVVTNVPSSYPLQWGATFANALLIDLPNMPMRAGQQIGLIMKGHVVKGVTFSGTVFAELWLNFWLVGALVGAALYGAVLKFLHQLRSTSHSYVIQGIAPAFLLGVVVSIATSVSWTVKGVILRLSPPIVAALLAAYVLRHLQIRASEHGIE